MLSSICSLLCGDASISTNVVGFRKLQGSNFCVLLSAESTVVSSLFLPGCLSLAKSGDDGMAPGGGDSPSNIAVSTSIAGSCTELGEDHGSISYILYYPRYQQRYDLTDTCTTKKTYRYTFVVDKRTSKFTTRFSW